MLAQFKSELKDLQILRQKYSVAVQNTIDAYADKDADLIPNFLQEHQSDFGPKLTEKLINLCSDHFITIPRDDIFWERSNLDGKYSLNEAGMNEVYQRLENRFEELSGRRYRNASLWIGIIGALTGLFSVVGNLALSLFRNLN